MTRSPGIKFASERNVPPDGWPRAPREVPSLIMIVTNIVGTMLLILTGAIAALILMGLALTFGGMLK